MLKKRALSISILYTVALLIVSLITIDLGGIEAFTPSFGDKIFHFFAYCFLTLTWFYTSRVTFEIKKSRAILIVSISAILFGIIIEVLQKVLTFTRVFDVGDIAANVFGVLLMTSILVFKTKTDVK